MNEKVSVSRKTIETAQKEDEKKALNEQNVS